MHQLESGLEPLRIGVVGLGLAGGVMVAAIKTHPAMQLVGGVDRDVTLRNRFSMSEFVPVYSELEELLGDPSIDAVYIATPHEYHRNHTIDALAAGKHVIVEKPMALSLQDCDAMIEAAAEYRRYLIVGHTHGFDPALKVMRDVVDSGRLGRLGMVVAMNYTDFLYRPRRPEELDSTRGGGVLFNQLPHQIEMIRTLVPSHLRSVRASSPILDALRPTEGACLALLDFENRVTASLVYSGYDGFDSDEWHDWTSEGGFRKTGSHGKARRALKTLDCEGERLLRRDAYGYGSAVNADFPTAQPHFGTLIATCERGDVRHTAEGVRIYDEAGEERVPMVPTQWRPGRGDVLEELRAAIRDGVAPTHDGRFGRDTLAACLAIQSSARERREVFLEAPVARDS